MRKAFASFALFVVACSRGTPASPTTGAPTPAAPAPAAPAAPAGEAAPTGEAAPAASGPSIVDAFEAAKRETATHEAKMLHAAAQMHLAAHGTCPGSIEQMHAAGMIAKVPVDPWGAGYVVACEHDGASLTVTSLGPDGKAATADDVRVSGS